MNTEMLQNVDPYIIELWIVNARGVYHDVERNIYESQEH